MTSQFTLTDSYGASFVDREAFAAALAPLVGATFTPEQPLESAKYRTVIMLLDGFNVAIHEEHGAKAGRLRLSIWSPLERQLTGGSGQIKWPAAITLDPARDLATLASDVKRRLIFAAGGALLRLHDALTAQSAAQDEAESTRAALAARFPNARVSLNADKSQVDVYGSGDVYLHAYMRDGRLSITRAGSFDADTSLAILAAIFKA